MSWSDPSNFPTGSDVPGILVVGASGLIGGRVMHRIDATAIVRTPLSKDITQRVAPVETWPDLIAELRPATLVSALGTTIKTAGSQAAFAAIDHDLVLAVAKAAKAAGARQCVMVSSVGANSRASNFYLKTKGCAEDGVRALDFDRLDILRPGLLIADRPGPARPFERLMIALSPVTNTLTPHMLDHYRGIDADSVAGAIAALVGAVRPGVFVHHNREMLALA